MEKSIKNLREMSILILILTALSFVRMVIEIAFTGLGIENYPDFASKKLIFVAIIIMVVLGFVLLLPQFYIGVKGLKISRNPDYSTAHIIWAKILFVFSIIGLVYPIIGIVKADNIGENIFEFADILLDTIVYYMYIKAAVKVMKV